MHSDQWIRKLNRHHLCGIRRDCDNDYSGWSTLFAIILDYFSYIEILINFTWKLCTALLLKWTVNRAKAVRKRGRTEDRRWPQRLNSHFKFITCNKLPTFRRNTLKPLQFYDQISLIPEIITSKLTSNTKWSQCKLNSLNCSWKVYSLSNPFYALQNSPESCTPQKMHRIQLLAVISKRTSNATLKSTNSRKTDAFRISATDTGFERRITGRARVENRLIDRMCALTVDKCVGCVNELWNVQKRINFLFNKFCTRPMNHTHREGEAHAAINICCDTVAPLVQQNCYQTIKYKQTSGRTEKNPQKQMFTFFLFLVLILVAHAFFSGSKT